VVEAEAKLLVMSAYRLREGGEQKVRVVVPSGMPPGGAPLVDPTADLISVLKLRVLGELWFFAEAG
jgi:hypothetical protein